MIFIVCLIRLITLIGSCINISILQYNKLEKLEKENISLTQSIKVNNEQNKKVINELKEKNKKLSKELQAAKKQSNKQKKKISELNKELKTLSNATNIATQTVPTTFKSYMDYRTITDCASYAYKLQQEATTDENGLRKIGEYYCVAMGTYFGKVGDTLYIETDEGACWKVILADIKSDEHTDCTHTYTIANGCMMEFIVDVYSMPSNIRASGTVKGLGFQGKITTVKHI